MTADRPDGALPHDLADLEARLRARAEDVAPPAGLRGRVLDAVRGGLNATHP